MLQVKSIIETRYRFCILMLLLCAGMAACNLAQSDRAAASDDSWISTWSTALQLVEPHNMPPEPGLSGNTIRQVVRVTLGGDQARLSISNEFGTEPASIHAVHVAGSEGGNKIDSETDVSLTFDGSPSVSIEPGNRIVSDPFSMNLEPLSTVAITMYIDSVGSDLTGHPGSRTTSFISPGNAVTDEEFADEARAERWYLIDAIDVIAPDSSAAVVILGDSITDGRGSGTDKQNRWPDVLADRLQAHDATKHIAVLNQGIGGNCVLRSCLGPAAIDRFERDVLKQPGARWVIILEGINDIGSIQDADHADEIVNDLIEAYTDMTHRAKENDLKVYGATLLPFRESFYDQPERERARQAVNEWIRTSDTFDAVIDLDKALEDPQNPGHLLPAADTGDHLHPNETGYRMIAETIDLSLFYE